MREWDIIRGRERIVFRSPLTVPKFAYLGAGAKQQVTRRWLQINSTTRRLKRWHVVSIEW